MNRREFAKLPLIALLSGILIAGPIACSVDQVIGLLTDAALIASAAGPLIPEYGAQVSAIGKDLSDLASLYSQFEKAQSADKPGIEGNIHALTSTALNSLQTIFYDTHIKDPKAKLTITAFVTAANTAIVALESKLGASATSTQVRAKVLSQASTLPVNTKAKTGADLKAAWNQAVKADHPEAVIR